MLEGLARVEDRFDAHVMSGEGLLPPGARPGAQQGLDHRNRSLSLIPVDEAVVCQLGQADHLDELSPELGLERADGEKAISARIDPVARCV